MILTEQIDDRCPTPPSAERPANGDADSVPTLGMPDVVIRPPDALRPVEKATALLETAKAHQIGRSREFWPDTALGLGRKIDLLRSALAEHGVTVSRIRRARERLIQLVFAPAADADHQGEE